MAIVGGATASRPLELIDSPCRYLLFLNQSDMGLLDNNMPIRTLGTEREMKDIVAHGDATPTFRRSNTRLIDY